MASSSNDPKEVRTDSPETGTESVGSSFTDEDADDPIPELASGAVIADRYALRSVLGRGGYAVVYLAQDTKTATTVAVKVLRADRLGPVALRRMSREAATMSRFQHDRLVKVLDHGVFGEGAYLVMEAVDGETLRARRARGPLSVDEAVRIACDVLEGLSVLHREGVVHRDVKPSNILLDREGRARLADFGLVSRWSEDQTRATQSHAIVGTVEYVSPEQALGEELDGRSDLYALGVVLFEMLSGAPLHGARSSLGMLVAHLTKPAPDVRASREGIPNWLASVVARLLEKDRRLRYKDAEAVLVDLKSRRAPGPSIAALKRRLTLALATGAAGLMLFLAFQAAPPPEAAMPAPVLKGAEVKGGLLRGLDDKGGVMWTRDLGVPLDDAAFSPAALRINPRLRVADLEGDGRSEVLVTAETEAGGLSHLVVFESNGTERFRHRPGRRVTYGKEDFDTFSANSIYFLIDSKGRRRLFLLSPHRPWFPSVLEGLDPKGQVVSEYFASGAHHELSRLTFHGREAIGLAGYHNETRGGSLTILSMDQPSGRSPGEDPAFLCTSCSQNDPLAIVVTPRSDTLVTQGGAKATARLTSVVAIDNGVLSVDTHHGGYTDASGGRQDALVAYRFSPDLTRLLEMSPNPHLAIAHDRLFKAGRLNHPFGPRDLAELRRVLTWDGTRWAPMPSQ